LAAAGFYADRDAAGFARIMADITLLTDQAQVLLHGMETFKAEMACDFTQRGRAAMLLLKGADKIKDLLLFKGQGSGFHDSYI
jgi:hypothetical protein